MSCVEALATGIKIESSDQNPFWGQIKGPRIAKIIEEHTAAPWPFENQALKTSEGNDQAIFADQNSWSQLQILD